MTDWPHAWDDYRRAAEIIETLRSGLAKSEYKLGFTSESKHSVYQRLVLIAAQQLEQPREAWRWAERARGRAFLDQLGSRVLIAPHHATPEWVEREQALLTELTQSELHLRHVDSEDERRRRLVAIHSLRSSIEELQKEIESDDSDYVGLRQGKQVPLCG